VANKHHAAADSILIVDDDPVCRELLGGILKELGWNPAVAADGHEAYEKICTGQIRIVISDWQMPGMSGLELCKLVRQRQLSDYVYFILLSSLSRSGNLIHGLQGGADDFLSKPIDHEELVVRLSVAERIISLENKNLLVFTLAKLAESRDCETGAHLERMREYSRLLAEHLSKIDRYAGEVDADYVRTIYLTSPLHDIGKVGIPDHILLKPGKLTVEEYEVMKQHALIGSQTLDAALQAYPSAQYLRFARDIAQSHHEKFDGTGYPHGLAGSAIPLCARIVAVADVYDALTTKRVYKEAFSHEVAKGIIVQGRGTDFDPDVVDAFLAQEENFLRVKARLNDHAPSTSILATNAAACRSGASMPACACN
jgi:putative two-component system response regulator